MSPNSKHLLLIIVCILALPATLSGQSTGQRWSKRWHADGGAHEYVNVPSNCDMVVQTVQWNGSKGPLQFQWPGIPSPVPQFFGNQGGDQNGYYSDVGLVLARGQKIDIQMQTSGADVYLAGIYECS
jgi:hypothetical protein